MDTEKVQKINNLAKSLHASHLVANLDEGVTKAKEILGYQDVVMDSPEISSPENELKTVNELFDEEAKAADFAEDAKDDLQEIKQEVNEENNKAVEEEKDIDEIDSEIENDIGIIKDIKEDMEEGNSLLRSGFSDEEDPEPKIKEEE